VIRPGVNDAALAQPARGRLTVRFVPVRADEGIRTLDLRHGKATL
jgi:hypothetical protein